jgi:hypothetical protein
LPTQSRSCLAIFPASAPEGRACFSTTNAQIASPVIVRPTHHGGLGDQRIRDQCRLDLHRSQSMARHVEHVVDAPHDGEVPGLLVAHRPVAGEVDLAAELLGVVGLPVALRIAPDRADHRGPGFLDDEHPALPVRHVVPGFIDDGRHDARQRQRAGAWHERRHPRQRRDQVPAGFGLPPGVHDRAALAAHVDVVPHPRFGVDRLADAQQRKRES